MSYLAFHATFILPPIALLAATSLARHRVGRRPAVCIAVVAAIALAYTTPWDNYLVGRGIWSYGEDRVLATIGYVPVEEYLFFALQPVLTGLWLFHVLARERGRAADRWAGPTSDRPTGTASVPPAAMHREPGVEPGVGTGRPASLPDHGPTVGTPMEAAPAARGFGAIACLGLAGVGALLLRHEAGTYLGLILLWAAPVLAAQWAYAGAAIWAQRRAWLLGSLVPTLYLWAADAAAIRLGIWSIAGPTTTGVRLLWLPLEEAIFFLATNLMVVQGMLLFLFPPGSRMTTSPRARAAAP